MIKEDKLPFLRWTGSKRWFIKKHIEQFLPREFNNYHEPFLGGASVFFYIKNKFKNCDQREYYLSDVNADLINVYEQLKVSADDVIASLKMFSNTKEYYYFVRASEPLSNVDQAAKFIYLNRTSFNGIYRVNSNGIYNVPYGHRANVDFVTEELLKCASELLKNVTLETVNFEESLKNIKENDLVFLDPPYTVAHENNGFIEYNQKLFSWSDQEKLKEMIVKIKEIGAFFILTNASHVSIEELYKDLGEISVLSRSSIVGGRVKTRGTYNELLIHNI